MQRGTYTFHNRYVFLTSCVVRIVRNCLHHIWLSVNVNTMKIAKERLKLCKQGQILCLACKALLSKDTISKVMQY